MSESEIFDNHLVLIGEMIEDMETIMRHHLEAVYVARTKEIIFTTRYENTIGMEKHRMGLANDLKKLRFGTD
jgi:predicted transcriptional regulator